MTTDLGPDDGLFRELGLAGMLLGDGHLEREAPLRWAVPVGVTLDEDHLVAQWWPDKKTDRKPAFRQPGTGMLEGFIQLATSDPVSDAERFARYASRWGMLGLCEHTVPLAVHSASSRLERDAVLKGHGLKHECHRADREPIRRWILYAHHARALVMAAIALHRDKRPTRDDFAAIATWNAAVSTEPYPRPKAVMGNALDPTEIQRHMTDPDNYSIQQLRLHVSCAVNAWAALGGVRPAMWWWREAPETRFALRMPTLLGGIALALMMAVSRHASMWTCDGCGLPYSPKRRPSASRRAYCPSCIESGQHWLDAQRRRRRGEAKPNKRTAGENRDNLSRKLSTPRTGKNPARHR